VHVHSSEGRMVMAAAEKEIAQVNKKNHKPTKIACGRIFNMYDAIYWELWENMMVFYSPKVYKLSKPSFLEVNFLRVVGDA
jgi:hypothetical protein